MKRIMPVIADKLPFFLSIWVVLLISFQIIGYGFLPPDDALRHSAKVISGRDWNQILVLRDDIKMDSHPGWHSILNCVHKILKWDDHSLVLFSIIFLFLLFFITPLFFLHYPESWLTTLILVSVFAGDWIFRLLLGRPYIFTMSVLLVICFLWGSLKSKKLPLAQMTFLTFAIALSTWIHCAWYLYALPIAAFFLAREWKAGIFFSLCVIFGVSLGAIFTGHPIIFLKQTLMHLFLAFGSVSAQRLLVTEFQSSLVDVGTIMMVLGLLGWRFLHGKWDRKVVDNPVFILAGLTMVLTFISRRALIDWGLPAIIAWMAMEFDDIFKKVFNIPRRRIVFSIVACLVLYLSVTSDAGNRWSRFKPLDYISAKDQDQKQWLPDSGGIIYSNDMSVFYSIFYKNPTADWRYILGFEPALMPEEELAIFRTIQENFGNYKYFYPWVKKMTPKDRLIVRGSPDSKPKIPELEWYYVAHNTWSGRLPRSH